MLTLFLARSVAQNDLILLTGNGAFFTLFVNGQQVNDSAQSVVLARGIADDTCTVKLIFSEGAIQPFSARILLREKGKTARGREFTYSLTEEKGKRKLRFISVNSVLSDTGAAHYPPEKKIKAIFEQLAKQKEAHDRANEIYPPPANCTLTISDSLLEKNIRTLRDNHIEANRLRDAKWFLSHHCIDTRQMLLVMQAFDREDSKAKIARFAYDYLYNSRDFLDLVPALKYASDQEDLKKFFTKRIEK